MDAPRRLVKAFCKDYIHGMDTRETLRRKLMRVRRRGNEWLQDRETTVLEAIEGGLPYREIAALAGLSHGAVGNIALRAKRENHATKEKEP
jgi:DNA-binding CsgD family transcriptional regulator